MMEFFLTGGLVDESDWQFIEMERFSIKLQSANPTIAEMVEEARKSDPDKKSVERYGEFYTLEHYKAGRLENKKKYSKEFFASRERLDETKTALDYNLKSGDVLLLGIDQKRRSESQK